VPDVLRLVEERRGVRAWVVRDAWAPVARDGLERRGAQEIWIAERRDARLADVLAREDSRERRAVMDSNSVWVAMASLEQLWGEPELPALQSQAIQRSSSQQVAQMEQSWQLLM